MTDDEKWPVSEFRCDLSKIDRDKLLLKWRAQLQFYVKPGTIEGAVVHGHLALTNTMIRASVPPQQITLGEASKLAGDVNV